MKRLLLFILMTVLILTSCVSANNIPIDSKEARADAHFYKLKGKRLTVEDITIFTDTISGDTRYLFLVKDTSTGREFIVFENRLGMQMESIN